MATTDCTGGAGSAEQFLESDTAAVIRWALLVGLSAFGELELIRNQAEILRRCGHTVPDELCPREITGDAETVSKFADALRLVESISA